MRRCGNHDSIPSTGIASGAKVSVQNYLIVSSWPSILNPITYSFTNYTTKLKDYEQRLAIQWAFNKWRTICGLNFKPLSQGGNGTIQFKFAKGNHGDKQPFDGRGNVLAHSFQPLFSPAPGENAHQGEIHFDDDEDWSFDDLKLVALHEIGHALGLGHAHSSNEVMYAEFRGNSNFGPDETLAIQTSYGVYPDDDKYSQIFGRNNVGDGIGTYDLRDGGDRAFSFDASFTGKEDNIVLYRPGEGILFIVTPSGFGPPMRFTKTYETRNGILDYDLRSGSDCALSLDYASMGIKSHIVLYRPGSGKLSVMEFVPRRNQAPIFEAAYTTSKGVGIFDLKDDRDQAFAIDYNSSGKMDHLVLYRPGTGLIVIAKKIDNSLKTVYESKNGIGDFTLIDNRDRAFALDYTHNGHLDHIVLYRPGTGAIFIFGRSGATFQSKYKQSSIPGSGIGGFDIESDRHSAYAFDYDGSGKMDHIVFYGPGSGTFWILKNDGGNWYPVYGQGAMGQPGNGVGTYDLTSEGDKSFAYDVTGADKSKNEHIVLYRPGKGIFFVLEKKK